jgi:hypothetical protein
MSEARTPFQEAIAAGGLPALEALRDRAAADLESATGLRDKAPLINRLRQLLAEIERLKPVEGEEDPVSFLQRRRKQGRGGVVSSMGHTRRQA